MNKKGAMSTNFFYALKMVGPPGDKDEIRIQVKLRD